MVPENISSLEQDTELNLSSSDHPSSPDCAQQPAKRTIALLYQDLLPSSDILTPEDGFDIKSIPFQTKTNAFGVYRVYPLGKPSYTPDTAFTLGHFSNASTILGETIMCTSTNPPPENSGSESDDGSDTPAIHEVFPNASIGLFMEWYHEGESTLMSKARADSLLKNVIQHPHFQKDEMAGFRMDLGLKMLDQYQYNEDSTLPFQDCWTYNTSVDISVPCDHVHHISEQAAPKFTVHGVQIRDILEVIRSALSEPAAEYFHLSGFWQYQKPQELDGLPVLQHDEVYTSKAFIQAQEEVTAIARADGWQGDVVVIALMLGSDSTRLASFGSQSLWPIYLQIGNLSKYVRVKPSTFATHHIAYIPKVSKMFHTMSSLGLIIAKISFLIISRSGTTKHLAIMQLLILLHTFGESFFMLYFFYSSIQSLCMHIFMVKI